jgi:hypothetical protein
MEQFQYLGYQTFGCGESINRHVLGESPLMGSKLGEVPQGMHTCLSRLATCLGLLDSTGT